MKNTKNKIGLIFILLFTVSVNAEYRLGVDYVMVSNPMPVKQDGVVEVMESFWYGCAACYSFEPSINSWAAQQGDDVRLTKMPITWGAIHQLHAALYYTIEALKLDPFNTKIYSLISNSYAQMFDLNRSEIINGSIRD